MVEQTGDYSAGVLQAALRSGLAGGSVIRLQVLSSSMQPLVHPGDAVLIQAVPLWSLQRGDIIAVWRESSVLTHRLIAADQHGWHTQGDASPNPDSAVAGAHILGRAVGIERRGRLIGLQRWRWRTLNRLIGWQRWREWRTPRLVGHSTLARRMLSSYRLILRYASVQLLTIYEKSQP